MKAALIIISTLVLLAGAVIVVGLLALYFGEDHQKFLAFDADREAWHRRCDVYINRPITTPAARACHDELEALLAYGKRQGW